MNIRKWLEDSIRRSDAEVAASRAQIAEQGGVSGVLSGIFRGRKALVWLPVLAVAGTIGLTRGPAVPAGALDELSPSVATSQGAVGELEPLQRPIQSDPQLVDGKFFRQTIGNSAIGADGQPRLRVQGYVYSGPLAEISEMTGAAPGAKGQGFVVRAVHVPAAGEPSPTSIKLYDDQTFEELGGRRTDTPSPVREDFPTVDGEVFSGTVVSSAVHGCGPQHVGVWAVAEFDEPVAVNIDFPGNVVPLGHFNAVLIDGRCELIPENSDYGLDSETPVAMAEDARSATSRSSDIGLT